MNIHNELRGISGKNTTKGCNILETCILRFIIANIEGKVTTGSVFQFYSINMLKYMGESGLLLNYTYTLIYSIHTNSTLYRFTTHSTVMLQLIVKNRNLYTVHTNTRNHIGQEITSLVHSNVVLVYPNIVRLISKPQISKYSLTFEGIEQKYMHDCILV